MKEDPDLRARLERLASNAGDPPERGLDRVAARRHRRLRRRRGAVVTAAALAVLLGAVWFARDHGPGDRDDLAVSPARRPTAGPAQLPSAVEVYCTADGGIEIPVASVRPQTDGLHVRVINQVPWVTEVSVRNGDWSARDSFRRGGWDMIVPVPPGSLTIGCRRGDRQRSLTVELVDTYGYYREATLECPPGDGEARLEPLAEDAPAARSMSTATDAALFANGFPEDLTASPPRGYASERLSDTIDEPRVQVNRDHDAVAFARLERTGNPDAPWRVAAFDGCESVLADRAPAGPTTTTTA